mgnify:CR=1 FL=1
MITERADRITRDIEAAGRLKGDTDKALADAGGRPLGLRVADALSQGGADPVVAVGGRAGSRLGLVTVPDAPLVSLRASMILPPAASGPG